MRRTVPSPAYGSDPRGGRVPGRGLPRLRVVSPAAGELDHYEHGLELWDGATETVWKECEPTSIEHEQPSRQLAQMAGQFAMMRGSRIACFGSADLVRVDASGRGRRLGEQRAEAGSDLRRAVRRPSARRSGGGSRNRASGGSAGVPHRRTATGAGSTSSAAKAGSGSEAAVSGPVEHGRASLPLRAAPCRPLLARVRHSEPSRGPRAGRAAVVHRSTRGQ